MKNTMISGIAVVALLAASTAMAQTNRQQQTESGARGGAVTGGAAGAVGGAIVGGPVGAIVGGAAGAAAGAAAGGATGALTAEDEAYFREHVIVRRVPSSRYQGDVVVGSTLPGSVTYYRIENNPRLGAYRYAYVNDRYVVVDGSNRIVDIID